ncbi:hypothetical protein DFH06DRAFT_1337156 [Mycena polygramma]|nr:hypothetical protein DFH06DRAFT_1337156 [Mycena polygramma]
MKLALVFAALLPSAWGANSFAGANNYYLYALPTADRIAILDGMKSAGMKVLRTRVAAVGAGEKTSKNVAVRDLEANGIGKYDDTILNMIDQLMVDAHAHGIAISYFACIIQFIGFCRDQALDCMHDKNALEAGDIYAKTYGVDGFYTNSAAINAFNQRITHILNGHKNALLGNKPWSELSSYIFGLEPQNEPMIFDHSFYVAHLSWICNAAKQVGVTLEISHKDLEPRTWTTYMKLSKVLAHNCQKCLHTMLTIDFARTPRRNEPIRKRPVVFTGISPLNPICVTIHMPVNTDKAVVGCERTELDVLRIIPEI